MRIVLQRVNHGNVVVEDKEIGKISKGYVLLVGVAEGDTEKEADYLAKKINQLRIFEDENEKMNLDIHQVGGSVLSISQFTLLADTKKGNRPSFIKSAPPAEASKLYDYFNQQLRSYGLEVSEGEFGAHMLISLENDGPVTIFFDTEHK
ncbi:D-aminoacyl-tRNA deacylase [Vagococcus carniphilus]|uniref:D-aminoacyl-tRNA deacylase n=1 Tax=Vagococcus carniphilus TaxID=218144 RepID=A0AAW8U318_9ENTE|nr:D-aminoacyl-tRNA deacylase [Vagococcus carniphilus]MDT2813504.1 D-aminoacyl-tRNA deacylase [Vagococcus carniphilus]MDT2829993.1 D-aminoacyl-tRNA deacylase [Vagococcus carniphilus]MDT2833928.1 D-aminoacyl-tRNA deacylase [Vagococcus carniphilus]MDT2838428.1 D-aminoacyl-tRNA deacylase [Vagococcus carniphilus]MDT2854424.1 D-aminoacyl-tRNA deacylase [Vagococcus carniphilus]